MSIRREQGLNFCVLAGNLPEMKTLTVDDYQRVRLPDAKPRTKFAYEEAGGVITLREIKVQEPPHPRLERRKGRTVVVSDKMVTSEDVARAMETFP